MLQNESMQALSPRMSLTGVRWRPTRDSAVAVACFLCVVACLYVAMQVFTWTRIAPAFITFGPLTLAGLGVAVPVFYTVLVRRRSLANLGITRANLPVSLFLGLLMGAETARGTLMNVDRAFTADVVPLVLMSLAVGLFEAIFFRGWLQQRFQDDFGVVPGVILAALCYSLYHVGYGMAVGELFYLFYLGVIFGSIFHLTKNVFVLWPFFTPVGGFYETFSSGLTMPFAATYGFLLTLGLMLAALLAGTQIARRMQLD